MTSTNAQGAVGAAIKSLTAIRDEIGVALAQNTGRTDTEARRLTEIHDRVARTIVAYHKG